MIATKQVGMKESGARAVHNRERTSRVERSESGSEGRGRTRRGLLGLVTSERESERVCVCVHEKVAECNVLSDAEGDDEAGDERDIDKE